MGEDLLGLDFDDYTNRNGFDVIYYETIEDYYSAAEFKKMYNPYRENSGNLEIANKPCKMNFSLESSEKETFDYTLLEKLFEEVLKEKNIDVSEKEKLYQKVEGIFVSNSDGENGGTKCNGFPFFTQFEPRDEEQLKEYDTLLFQIDSGGEIMIGDCGVMNFFINREKLKNKDFSDVFYNWDCY